MLLAAKNNPANKRTEGTSHEENGGGKEWRIVNRMMAYGRSPADAMSNEKW
jgi:hypothetical protein